MKFHDKLKEECAIFDNTIYCEKGIGLVSEVFNGNELDKFPGSKIAIGHNRYSTTGNNTVENVQPFIAEYLTGRLATAHNGNVTNAKEIKEKLKNYGLNFHATSDSEVVSSLIAYHVMKRENELEGIIQAAEQLKGAFSLVILCSNNKLVAVRDPNGYRPLCIGQSKDGIAIASESCALDSCGFELVRDVKAGEVIVIENGNIVVYDFTITNYIYCD